MKSLIQDLNWVLCMRNLCHFLTLRWKSCIRTLSQENALHDLESLGQNLWASWARSLSSEGFLQERRIGLYEHGCFEGWTEENLARNAHGDEELMNNQRLSLSTRTRVSILARLLHQRMGLHRWELWSSSPLETFSCTSCSQSNLREGGYRSVGTWDPQATNWAFEDINTHREKLEGQG